MDGVTFQRFGPWSPLHRPALSHSPQRSTCRLKRPRSQSGKELRQHENADEIKGKTASSSPRESNAGWLATETLPSLPASSASPSSSASSSLTTNATPHTTASGVENDVDHGGINPNYNPEAAKISPFMSPYVFKERVVHDTTQTRSPRVRVWQTQSQEDATSKEPSAVETEEALAVENEIVATPAATPSAAVPSVISFPLAGTLFSPLQTLSSTLTWPYSSASSSPSSKSSSSSSSSASSSPSSSSAGMKKIQKQKRTPLVDRLYIELSGKAASHLSQVPNSVTNKLGSNMTHKISVVQSLDICYQKSDYVGAHQSLSTILRFLRAEAEEFANWFEMYQQQLNQNHASSGATNDSPAGTAAAPTSASVDPSNSNSSSSRSESSLSDTSSNSSETMVDDSRMTSASTNEQNSAAHSKQKKKPKIPESPRLPCRDVFLLPGNLEILLKWIKKPASSGTDRSLLILVNRNLCLAALRELCYIAPQLVQMLRDRHDIVRNIFEAMTEKRLFLSAARLLEEMASVRDADAFPLRAIEFFPSLIQKLPDAHIVYLCRFMEIFIFESDYRGIVEKDFASTERKTFDVNTFGKISNLDLNLAYLLNIPGFFKKLVRLLKETPKIAIECEMYLVHYNISANEAQSSFRNLMQILDLFEYADQMPEGHENGVLTFPSPDDHAFMHVQPVALSKFEILFFLSAALCSKRKIEMQRLLIREGIMPVLLGLFDQLKWDEVIEPSAHLIHGPLCTCNQANSVNIQYLRFITFLSEVTYSEASNKELISAMRHSLEVNSKGTQSGPQPSSRTHALTDEQIHWHFWCKNLDETDGLVAKLIKVLLAEPPDYMTKQWLLNSLEVFLRNAGSKCRKYAVNMGIIEYIVKEVLKPKTDENLGMGVQFDILGEIIKFSDDNLQRITATLSHDDFKKICEVIESNLIESNFFVRALTMCGERQRGKWRLNREAETSTWEEHIQSTPLLSFLYSEYVRLICKLISSLTLKEICSGNICCLNTMIIMFYHSEKNGLLEDHLKSAHAQTPNYPRLFENLTELLAFWRIYYLGRNLDCMALEYATKIPIRNLFRCVSRLQTLMKENFPNKN